MKPLTVETQLAVASDQAVMLDAEMAHGEWITAQIRSHVRKPPSDFLKGSGLIFLANWVPLLIQKLLTCQPVHCQLLVHGVLLSPVPRTTDFVGFLCITQG